MTKAFLSEEPLPLIAEEPITLRMPELHEHQQVFLDWTEDHPDAQVLVAPCGVKFGKSFAAAVWLLTEALINPGFYCVWIAPTQYKARIGYRYMKAMLPDLPFVTCIDGSLEIRLGTGSFIKFLHGKDAEVTVEGDAIDAFVMDEAGKQTRQLWLSLFTTITQTMGKGIITGTPRGHTWYAEIFKMAKAGDPFFAWCQLPTELSPYVAEKALENAKRLLPKNLYDQYYLARFISFSSVFGELDDLWDDQLKPPVGKSVWLHPDIEARAKPTVVGADWAKINDWTVFLAINADGQLVGYCRFRGGPYPQQVRRLCRFMRKLNCEDLMLRYDKTGVGEAIEDILNEEMNGAANDGLDVSITGVTFTNQSKQDMVTRTTIAVSEAWVKAPRIERLEQELTSLDVMVTPSGMHRYSAPEGEHDDVAWAFMLAVSGAYESAKADETEEMIAEAMGGGKLGKTQEDDDVVADWAGEAAAEEGEDPDDWEDDDFDDAELDE